MNCQDTEEVIHGYLDGELDLVRSLAVEQHLKDCQVCARAYRERQGLRTAISGGSLYFEVPKGLERRVCSVLGRVGRAEAGAARPHRSWNWRWSSFLGPLAAAALVMLIALPWATRRSAESAIAEEIVSAHVRSLMLEHKTDIASSDQHTVKPWFDGKLDFAPSVVDLAERGYPLLGGRLDYLSGRPVAALVYQRHKHFINVFIWPAAVDSNSVEKVTTRRGYNLISWTASGMSFWAVSDLNKAELGELVRLIK